MAEKDDITDLLLLADSQLFKDRNQAEKIAEFLVENNVRIFEIPEELKKDLIYLEIKRNLSKITEKIFPNPKDIYFSKG